MGPDLFTVIAQIVNFLILVALLQRFLYRPIVRAMDRREAEIAARQTEAAKKAEEAEQERGHYETLLRELTETREDMRARAREEADTLRGELLESTRQEVNQCRMQWQESFRSERDAFYRSLHRHVCREVCTVCRKVLRDMVDTSLEERMAVYLEQWISNLGVKEREGLSEQFRNNEHGIIVRSAFEMNPEARKIILRALNILTKVDDLHFEIDPSLVCGVEILADGRSLAWNLEEYLDGLEERLTEAMGKGTAIRGDDSLTRSDNHGIR